MGETTLLEALIATIESDKEAIDIARKILASKGLNVQDAVNGGLVASIKEKLKKNIGQDVYLNGNIGLLETTSKGMYQINFVYSGIFQFKDTDVASFDDTTKNLELKDIKIQGHVG